MSIRSKGLVFAMEEGEVVEPVVDMAPAVQAEVEQGTADIVEDAAAIEELVDAVDDAASDAGTLGDVEAVMTDSVEQGEGLPPAAAEIAEVAVEAICARLGIKKQRTLPSLESFGSKTSRVAATRIATEQVMDLVKKVWAAIQKTFESVYAKVVSFLKAFFSNVEKVKQLATQLKAKAEAATGEAKVKEVQYTDFINTYLSGAKTSVGLAEVKKSLDSRVAVTKTVASTMDIIKGAVESTQGLILKSFDEVTSEVQGTAKKVSESIKSANSEASAEASDSGAFVVDLGDKPETVKGIKGTTLSGKDLAAICDEVQLLATATEAFKKDQAKIEGIFKAFTKLAEQVQKTNESKAEADESKFKKVTNYIRNFATSLNTSTTRVVTQVPVSNIRACKAALNVVSLNLKNY